MQIEIIFTRMVLHQASLCYSIPIWNDLSRFLKGIQPCRSLQASKLELWIVGLDQNITEIKTSCRWHYDNSSWYMVTPRFSPLTSSFPWGGGYSISLLGLCVWKSCEKGVKSVWKKGTMWNHCWQKYKFTTSAFHMHVNFLTYVWNFVIHMKNFCHMCELFFPCSLLHVKSFHRCETILSSMWISISHV